MRCLDLLGFFDGYSFDIDFFAAEKVYYCEAFDVLETVGEENVYFFAHFRSLLINLFCKSFILFSAMDYSIFCLELQCLFGAFCFYHISGFKSFGNGSGYVSPFKVSVSSSLALFTNSGFCRKSMAVRAMILAA